MRTKIELFKENKVIGGYSIAVRDDWSFKIKRMHLSEADKEKYVQKFGHKIILESELMDWWTEINNLKPSEQFLKSLGKDILGKQETKSQMKD